MVEAYTMLPHPRTQFSIFAVCHTNICVEELVDISLYINQTAPREPITCLLYYLGFFPEKSMSVYLITV